jgi:hypothetical protein
MAKRKGLPAVLNRRNYPTPKVWVKGFVSKAQERKFSRTPSLRKYHPALLAYTGSGNTKAAKLRGLPQRVSRRKKR